GGALVGLCRGHTHIGDHDVRRVAAHLQQQVVGVGGTADDVEAGVCQQGREALAHQHRVFGDHDPHGISPITRVPLPASLSTRSRPSSAATRAARLRSPTPSPRAPPIPSPATSLVTVPPACRPLTIAAEARACLTVFASASQTTKYAAASTCGGRSRSGTSTETTSGVRAASDSIAVVSPAVTGFAPCASSRSSTTAAC